MPFELSTSVPHRIQHRYRPERTRILSVELSVSPAQRKKTYLLKSPVHLAAHTPLIPLFPSGWFAHQQTSGAGAYVPVMLLAEKVRFEEGVMDECLEDGGEETGLGEVEKGSQA